jgi:hypothetical protein
MQKLAMVMDLTRKGGILFVRRLEDNLIDSRELGCAPVLDK